MQTVTLAMAKEIVEAIENELSAGWRPKYRTLRESLTNLRLEIVAAEAAAPDQAVDEQKKIRVLVRATDDGLANVAHDTNENIEVFIVDAEQGADEIPSGWEDLANQLGVEIDD